MTWYDAPEYDRNPMKFPAPSGKLSVVVVRPERKSGDKEQPANERVHIFRGRCLPI